MTSTISQALREGRQALGLQQQELAERLGVSTSYLCDVERGRRSLPIKYVEKLPDGMRRYVAEAMIAERQQEIAEISARAA